MTALARSLAAVVTHRPLVAVGAAVAASLCLGAIAAVRPADVQALFVVPLLVVGALRVFRHGFAGVANGEWLTRMATTGLILRLGFVALHLAIGFWFYGGAVDFVNWQRVPGEIWSTLATGSFYDFGVLTPAGSLGDMGIGNLTSLVLLTPVAAMMGPSLLGMFPACAVLGAVGAYMFLRSHQLVAPDAVDRRFLARALFLLPAVGFWSIYLGKDSLAFFLLGWSTYALARLLVQPAARHLAALAVSLTLLIGVRPHMGAVASIGLALALGFQPLERRGAAGYLRPVKRLLLLVVVSAGAVLAAAQGILLLGVQAITVELLAERAYVQQRGFVGTEAGSVLPATLESGDPVEVARAIPFGVFTLLFRPLPWEAHNALAVAAAAENVFLIGLVLWRRRALLASLRAALGQPFVLYSLAVFLAGSAVLSFNWNLGTLARHRTMVMPFLMILLAGPTSRARDERRRARERT